MEIEVDLDFSTEKIVEIFTKFIENFFKDKTFNGQSSIEIRKNRYSASCCYLEIELEGGFLNSSKKQVALYNKYSIPVS